MKDEDLDSCPRCKEDMWKGQRLCNNCQHEDDMEEWPGGDDNPFNEIECDVCGYKTDNPEGRHYCSEDGSDE